MEFPERLTHLRKAQGLTQKVLAEQVGVHLTQIQRYENGSTQPTLAVLRKLAVALRVSADMLLFDMDERSPEDDFKLQFEALAKLSPEEQQVAKAVLEGLILKHQTKRLVGDLSS